MALVRDDESLALGWLFSQIYPLALRPVCDRGFVHFLMLFIGKRKYDDDHHFLIWLSTRKHYCKAWGTTTVSALSHVAPCFAYFINLWLLGHSRGSNECIAVSLTSARWSWWREYRKYIASLGQGTRTLRAVRAALAGIFQLLQEAFTRPKKNHAIMKIAKNGIKMHDSRRI